MSGQPTLVLALTPLAERQIEPLIFDAEAPVRLLSSVVEADELPAAVSEQHPDAVLISPELSGLTPAHCERVRASGARLVGLALDERERKTLSGLGVETTIDADVAPQELLDALEHTEVERPTVTIAKSSGVSSAPPQRSEDRGSIVAVLGVRGAPGASELACGLAALASRRWATVLVEADALGGSLAARLGVDPGHGSLTGLIRATQAGEGGLRELLERWLVQPEGWPAVLLGASDSQSLADLAEPGAMSGALTALAATYPVVVCDVGFMLTDTRQQPVHLHREALLSADAVLLVLGARETQLHAGLRQLELLLDTIGIPAERLRILIGQAGAPASASKTEITNTIATHLAERGLALDAWLPFDARAARRAQRHGTPIVLARRHGAYARTVNRLLDDLFIPTDDDQPRAKKTKRRLTAPPRRDSHDEEVVWQR